MNANELRIGNWIERLDNGLNYGYAPKQKWVLHEVLAADILDVLSRPNLYRPSQLSKELLLMLGFKKSSGYNSYELDNPTFIIELTDGGFLYDNILIKSAHQLQNLYHALHGSELPTDHCKLPTE